MTTMPFDKRLALARRFRAELAGLSHPEWLGDQAGAAARDADLLLDELARTLGGNDTPAERHDETATAHTLAALLDCQACVHLRRGGPQPAVARLVLRRVDCRRCAATHRRPPAGEDDRCDWCGGRGVGWFRPTAIRLGMTVVVGDACQACSTTLGGVAA